MAFVAITTGEIASGEPNKNTTWTKVKNNFDDHESRIETLENSNTGDAPIILRVNGRPFVKTGVLKTTVNFGLKITGVRILVDTAGSSGTIAVDIQKKSGDNSYVSILSSSPTIEYSAGNDALSSNAVLDATKVDLIAGDILRLDITSVQTEMVGFLVRIDFSRN